MLIIEDQAGNRVECSGNVRIASPQALWPRAVICETAIVHQGFCELHYDDRAGRDYVRNLSYPISTSDWERGRTLALIRAGLERSMFTESWFLERESALAEERERLSEELLGRLAA